MADKPEAAAATPEELDALAKTGTGWDDDEPTGPVDYGNDPEAPAAPAEPAKPAEPEAPAKPEAPTEAAAPEAPAEPEAASEPEAPAKPAKPPREEWIPRSRFDEVNAKRKAAEAKLAERAAAAAAPIIPKADSPAGPTIADEIAQKDVEYNEALLDGDVKKAAAIRQEQRALERRQMQIEAQEVAQRARAEAREDIATQAVIDELQNTYEVFNTESANYDDDLTNEAIDLQSVYISRGLSRSQALAKAADMVLRANGILPNRKPEDPAPAAAKEPVKPSPTQVKAKLELASKQPTQLPARGKEEPAPSIDEMPDEEFDALPEATKKRLRGDYG